MQPPAKPHNHGHSPRQRAKTLSQSGSRDTQMVARRNLLLRRRRHQRFLTQLTPHTQVILSVCCDPLPMAAQRIALHPKFRCYRFSLADQPVASRCEADRSRRPGPRYISITAAGVSVVPQMHETRYHHITQIRARPYRGRDQRRHAAAMKLPRARIGGSLSRGAARPGRRNRYSLRPRQKII